MKAKNMTKAAWLHWCAVLCCILTLACTGCSSLTTAKSKSGKKDSSWSFFKKKPYQSPQSINVTWTYDIYTKEGKPPTRGFGGRLYFYNEKSQAIPVEGELTVYGFDDTERSHDGASIESADKRFRFLQYLDSLGRSSWNAKEDHADSNVQDQRWSCHSRECSNRSVAWDDSTAG
jgi:hypothetical protein